MQGFRNDSAAQRIANLFLELLEKQFPIADVNAIMKLRTPADFARKLNIHVNHLNRALKKVMHKTTSQIISERILHESKTLLQHNTWHVSEIAHVLRFKEVTHFNNFFKKNLKVTPLSFRKTFNHV